MSEKEPQTRKQVTAEVIAIIEASNLDDYDQRSALGMARTWVDKPGPVGWNAERHVQMREFPHRDNLAKQIVAVLQGAKRADALRTLTVARALVNAPFLDPSMLGFRARRTKQGLVGSEKKNEKLAKA